MVDDPAKVTQLEGEIEQGLPSTHPAFSILFI